MGIGGVTSRVQRGTPINGNVPRKQAHASMHAETQMLYKSLFNAGYLQFQGLQIIL